MDELETTPPRGKQDHFLPISILVAAVLISGAILFATFYKGGFSSPQVANIGSNIPSTSTAQTAGGNTAATSATLAALATLGTHDVILGSSTAPITLIEYGDYQCPFCGQFFSQTESQIISNYVNTGKVRMVFRNFPFLGAESTAAANAAECAQDQGAYWPYHDALYNAKLADDAVGGGENDGFFTRTEFLALAQKLKLNIANFAACIDAGTDNDVVSAEKAAAVAAGINSTPTFLINGQELVGAYPYSVFQTTLDALNAS